MLSWNLSREAREYLSVVSRLLRVSAARFVLPHGILLWSLGAPALSVSSPVPGGLPGSWRVAGPAAVRQRNVAFHIYLLSLSFREESARPSSHVFLSILWTRLIIVSSYNHNCVSVP